MDNSLFTHYLLEAFKGGGPVKGDGLVRVFDVFQYVSDMVPSKASQHPIFKAHDLENNFAISLDRGGNKTTNVSETVLKTRPTNLSGKARLEIRKGLVSRWVDVADYFDFELVERDACKRAESPPAKLLDLLEERKLLYGLRDAFSYLEMDDLIEVLDCHPH